LALKARREISEYIAAGKEDRARIRVIFFSTCFVYFHGADFVDFYRSDMD